ncbi:MAG: hypothetical protein K6T88_14705 [Bacillus sp. (in: Bacteria)]|nr:hypothetical protein [Bacillus sp. (in: firmicutes)]
MILNGEIKYIDGLHTNSNYTAIAHLWLLKQTLHSPKCRFVTDEDGTLMKSIYRVFSEEFLPGEVHHFLCKIDRDKTIQDAFREYIVAASKLKDWGEANGFEEQSLKKLVETKVSFELNK